jgi:hypothetical protein
MLTRHGRRRAAEVLGDGATTVARVAASGVTLLGGSETLHAPEVAARSPQATRPMAAAENADPRLCQATDFAYQSA